MDRQLNYRGQIMDDKRKTNDLKLSVGLQHEGGIVVFRLHKSRVSRRRFESNLNEHDEKICAWKK